MNMYFNPGCALSLYKPDMVNKILGLIKKHYGNVSSHNICCHFNPQVQTGSLMINVCAGCDRRFRSLYEGITTISIWELIDGFDKFIYPDYQGLKMSVHDACPVRERPQVHKAVRNLLNKMNIEIVETKFCGTSSICCGDDFFGKIQIEKVHQKMKDRADSMPCEHVCVYCVSCIKSMHIGGKTPRHLMDLLMNETTEPQTFDTVQWHEQLNEYRAASCISFSDLQA